MRTYILVPVTIALSIMGIAPVVAAGSENDFKAALAAAEAANREAGTLKNQWTTTVQELDSAKKAAAAGAFERAIDFAKDAEALAKASIVQAKEQAEAWKDAEIR